MEKKMYSAEFGSKPTVTDDPKIYKLGKGCGGGSVYGRWWRREQR